MKSILHIGGVAGVPQELSRAQRRLGCKSDVLYFYLQKFDYELDLFYPPKVPISIRSLRYVGPALTYIEEMRSMLSISSNYDILHFHSSSVLPKGFDIILWKKMGKEVIMHYHGSDIRNRKEPRICSKFIDKRFVSTPDLLKWSPNALWIPNPISLEEFRYVGIEEKSDLDIINIVHAPSNRTKKGTDFIINAVKELKNKNYKIRLVLVENMPHRLAIEKYKNADIIIDQLLIGWYGVFAVESMAYGKPVCAYIDNSLKKYLPYDPIINTSRKNIFEQLKTLIEDIELRKEFGKLGRKYVEEMHDANKIAKTIDQLI